MRGPIDIARIILLFLLFLLILSTLKRRFAPLNMHEKSGKFAHMSGLVKNFVFYSRFTSSPVGGAIINITVFLNCFANNFQTVHRIFKNLISLCSGDCCASSDISHAHFRLDFFFATLQNVRNLLSRTCPRILVRSASNFANTI